MCGVKQHETPTQTDAEHENDDENKLWRVEAMIIRAVWSKPLLVA